MQAAGDAGLLVLMAGPDVAAARAGARHLARRDPRGPRPPRDRARPRVALTWRRACADRRARDADDPADRARRPADGAVAVRAHRHGPHVAARRPRAPRRAHRALARVVRRQRRARRRLLHVRAGRRRPRPGVVGISAIEAAVGPARALVQLSRRHARARVARRSASTPPRRRCSSATTTPATPSSARCSSTRRSGAASNGALLSKSRLLFIAEFADRFAPKVIAELRGRLDADGRSPFWEGLGRHFFAMEYSTADYLTGIGQKSFIAELMPRHPVYVEPAAARRARGDRRGARGHARPRARCSSRKASATKATSTSSTPGPPSNASATTSTRCAARACCRSTIGEGDPVPDSLTDDILWLVSQPPLRRLPRAGRGGAARASTAFRCCRTRRRALERRRGRHRARGAAAPSRALSVAAIDDRAGAVTVNFDGIPGPTHNYVGPRARQPRRRAQRGARRQSARWRRCRARQDAGARRARLSRRPCCRRTSGPHMRGAARARLRRQRRAGGRARRRAMRRALLAACSSAAAMWVANAATVSPSARHRRRPRALHAGQSRRRTSTARSRRRPRRACCARIFADDAHFARARSAAGRAAVRRRGRREPHAVRRGRRRAASSSSSTAARRSATRRRRRRAFPRGRRAKRSEAIARRHGLDPARTLFAQQHPGRDRRRRVPQRRDRRRRRRTCCSATSARSSDQAGVLDALGAPSAPALQADRRARRRACASPTRWPPISSTASCCARADGRMLLVAPAECRENPRAARAISTACSRRAAGRSTKCSTSTCARACATAAARRACGCASRCDRAERAAIGARVFAGRRAVPTSSTTGSTRTIATGSRRRISPTRRCSTSRGARSTS